MKRKKLKQMLNFLKTSVEEMEKEKAFESWSDDLIFETAFEVTLNEFSAKGSGTPFAKVNTEIVAFCLNEDQEKMEVTIIRGNEDAFSDD